MENLCPQLIAPELLGCWRAQEVDNGCIRGVVRECPGMVAMTARQTVATSEDGGCPCRQPHRCMTSAVKDTLRTTLNGISTHSCCPWRWWAHVAASQCCWCCVIGARYQLETMAALIFQLYLHRRRWHGGFGLHMALDSKLCCCFFYSALITRLCIWPFCDYFVSFSLSIFVSHTILKMCVIFLCSCLAFSHTVPLKNICMCVL